MLILIFQLSRKNTPAWVQYRNVFNNMYRINLWMVSLLVGVIWFNWASRGWAAFLLCDLGISKLVSHTRMMPSQHISFRFTPPTCFGMKKRSTFRWLSVLSAWKRSSRTTWAVYDYSLINTILSYSLQSQIPSRTNKHNFIRFPQLYTTLPTSIINLWAANELQNHWNVFMVWKHQRFKVVQ